MGWGGMGWGGVGWGGVRNKRWMVMGERKDNDTVDKVNISVCHAVYNTHQAKQLNNHHYHAYLQQHCVVITSYIKHTIPHIHN